MATNFANALKLLQAKTEIDKDQLGYVNTILMGSSISAQIPIVQPSDFNTHKYFEKKQKSTSLLSTRVLNQNPDPTAVNQYEEKTEATFLIGSAVEVDHRILKRKPTFLDQAVNDRLRDLGHSLDYKIINGDPQGNANVDLRGLKDRLDTLNTNLFNSSDLTINTDASTFRTFVSLLRKAARNVQTVAGNIKMAWTSEMVYDGIINGRLLLGGQTIGSKYTDLLNTEDVIEVEGIPIMFTRKNDAGTDIISEAEANSTSSLYICSVGLGVDEEGTLPNGLLGLSDGEVTLTPQVDGNIRRVTIDYQYGLAAPTRCAARIRQLKAS